MSIRPNTDLPLSPQTVVRIAYENRSGPLNTKSCAWELSKILLAITNGFRDLQDFSTSIFVERDGTASLVDQLPTDESRALATADLLIEKATGITGDVASTTTQKNDLIFNGVKLIRGGQTIGEMSVHLGRQGKPSCFTLRLENGLLENTGSRIAQRILGTLFSRPILQNDWPDWADIRQGEIPIQVYLSPQQRQKNFPTLSLDSSEFDVQEELEGHTVVTVAGESTRGVRHPVTLISEKLGSPFADGKTLALTDLSVGFQACVTPHRHAVATVWPHD